VAGSSAVICDKAMLRQVRGSMWNKIEPGFFIIMLLSIVLHGGLIFSINRMKLPPQRVLTIEEIPDRFVKFIIEKPMPKDMQKKNAQEVTGPASEAARTQGQTETLKEEITPAQRAVAQKNVATRVANVESKIRTVGVLGLLTGTGTTAKGAAVIDVLGSRGNRKERNQDLELALQGQAGLIKTSDAGVLEQKVVQSKDIPLVGRSEDIDDLLDMGKTTTKDLMKTGNIIIRPPESIEGAASSNARRNDDVIGEIVTRNKAGIKLSYDKFLKRDPDLAGKITIRFTISAAGTVTTVAILENTTGNIAFEQELIRKIKLWRFDEVPEGDVTVTYPFLFNPS
jgi:TonB family protein